MLLGGNTVEGRATFAKFAAKIPARIAPEAVRTVLDFYAEQRRSGEQFGEFLHRVGIPRFQQLLERVTGFDRYEQREDLQYDLGEAETFKAEIGVGECAS
jgi:sulfite reductase (ferredoxin)